MNVSVSSNFCRIVFALFAVVFLPSCNQEDKYVFSVDRYGMFVENSEVVFREEPPVEAYLLLGSEVDHEEITAINSKFSDVFVTQDENVNSIFKITFLPDSREAQNVYDGFRDSIKNNLNIFYKNKTIFYRSNCFIMTIVDSDKYVLAYTMFSLEVDESEYEECLDKYVDFYLKQS